jgi:hypothetical protein
LPGAAVFPARNLPLPPAPARTNPEEFNMFLRTKIALAVALIALAAGCIHVDQSTPSDPYTYEVEPNDFAFSAQGIGPIDVRDRFLIRGQITDQGFDPFDGFAFKACGPMDIEFALTSDDPNADFDVQLFDPYTSTTVARWETSANPETGVFSLSNSGMEFHLVVSSFVGSGSYTLEVRGAPLTWFGDGEGVRFNAPGSGRAGGTRIDWTEYASRVPASTEVSAPLLELTTLAIDPETGRTKILGVRRIGLRFGPQGGN